ncbi:hypothetical protein AN965_13625, partial [Alkalicoccobacillus plakortidis]
VFVKASWEASEINQREEGPRRKPPWSSRTLPGNEKTPEKVSFLRRKAQKSCASTEASQTKK